MNYKNNKEYIKIVKDIIDNIEFNNLEEFKHHGDNRKSHSIRVSYYSYVIAKKFKLNSTSVARAGLLHDFFHVNNQKLDIITRIKVLFTHPKLALENSKKYFELSKMEENIIESHMFPIGIVIPKYKESILVNLVDDFCSIYERICSVLARIKLFLSKFEMRKRLVSLFEK